MSLGYDKIPLEQDFMDMTVPTEKEKNLCEIKIEFHCRSVIQNALGHAILQHADKTKL